MASYLWNNGVKHFFAYSITRSPFYTSPASVIAVFCCRQRTPQNMSRLPPFTSGTRVTQARLCRQSSNTAHDLS